MQRECSPRMSSTLRIDVRGKGKINGIEVRMESFEMINIKNYISI